MIRAVFFDFGGVLLSSPFEAFERYEIANGLPVGAVRQVNATNPDHNAWARLERGEVDLDEFAKAFEREAADQGFHLDGMAVLDCLRGELRPEMVEVLRRCSDKHTTALLTNNFVTGTTEWSSGGSFGHLLPYFDVVVESSTAGCRKPERRFYEIALAKAGVEPHEVVFLDDLGINLKPARELGMKTVKVTDPQIAITELEQVLGMPLR